MRTPAIDEDCPDTSDVDVAVFADVEDLYPERLALSGQSAHGGRTIDVTWLPEAWLGDPDVLAAHGLIAHRLATSMFVSGDPSAAAAQAAVVDRFYRSDIQARRVSGFFEMARLTVLEVGITWDFPALALFWLHMAHAACLAAALEGLRRRCPNVYTRPAGYLTELEAATGEGIASEWREALRLDADPAQAIRSLRCVHAIVSGRFREPGWPDSMRMTTRCEYRYWISADELHWRISVAEEMCRRGQPAAAIHYLRFVGYAVARAPMVHARAAEGRDVSYLRPEQSVRRDLARLCPDILDDLNVVLGGGAAPDVRAVERGLTALHVFRDRVIEMLCERDVPVPLSTAWTPCRPAPRDHKEASCQI
jgi:hypothetical protein